MTDKALLMIGMARRANKASMGYEKCVDALRKKKSRLIIIARDASDNTRKSVHDSCRHYGVECIEYGSLEELGHITSSPVTAVVSINDDNLAKAVLDRAS